MSQPLLEMSDTEACDLLRAVAGMRVAVVGDVMLDRYLHGPLERISPEAPVPIFEVSTEEDKLGGAANVAACLRALGAQVMLCGVVGDDQDGTRLSDTARQMGIDVSSLVVDTQRPTTTKTRIVARNQQVLRLDREQRLPLQGALAEGVLQQLERLTPWADAVLLSDYAKGVLTPAICRQAIRASCDKPVLVDPKKLPWVHFRGATVLKPNRVEAEQFAGIRVDGDRTAARVAEQMAESLQVAHVLLTRGASGMTVSSRVAASDPQSRHLSARPRELVDVTGAGDVVAATVILALAAGTDIYHAAWLANVAAGIKVGNFGAATVTPREILAALGHRAPSFAQKVMPAAEAATLCRTLQARGKRIVFTNGCFDLLHLGHVTCLEQSKQLGDFLVVGVNSDASVRRLKGSTRPIQQELDRARIVASQTSVDAVVVFDEDTPLELIRTLRPLIVTKGADYANKQAVVGWQLVESWGGRVVLIELVEGRSTSLLVQHAA